MPSILDTDYEAADAMAEDAMERQAYERHIDEELDTLRGKIVVITRTLNRLQQRHTQLTGRRHIW